ncbi:hypothetical protein FRC03_009035 [Tulasnella sp. 419]|nr:hypothetical protein FRC03_009035 [Tulasnella sp. 419]
MALQFELAFSGITIDNTVLTFMILKALPPLFNEIASVLLESYGRTPAQTGERNPNEEFKSFVTQSLIDFDELANGGL